MGHGRAVTGLNEGIARHLGGLAAVIDYEDQRHPNGANLLGLIACLFGLDAILLPSPERIRRRSCEQSCPAQARPHRPTYANPL
jgi:hypothetical protein